MKTLAIAAMSLILGGCAIMPDPPVYRAPSLGPVQIDLKAHAGRTQAMLDADMTECKDIALKMPPQGGPFDTEEWLVRKCLAGRGWRILR